MVAPDRGYVLPQNIIADAHDVSIDRLNICSTKLDVSVLKTRRKKPLLVIVVCLFLGSESLRVITHDVVLRPEGLEWGKRLRRCRSDERKPGEGGMRGPASLGEGE